MSQAHALVAARACSVSGVSVGVQVILGIVFSTGLVLVTRKMGETRPLTVRIVALMFIASLPLSYVAVRHDEALTTGGIPFPVLYSVTAKGHTTTGAGWISVVGIVGNAGAMLVVWRFVSGVANALNSGWHYWPLARRREACERIEDANPPSGAVYGDRSFSKVPSRGCRLRLRRSSK